MPLLTRQLDDQEKSELAAATERALARLSLDAMAEPETIVRAASELVVKEQAARTQRKLFGLIKNNASDPTEIIAMMGFVWGAQIKRAVGWDWVMAMRGEDPEYALTSSAREYAVFPLTFVKRMLTAPYEPSTLLEVFDTIKRGRHAPAERGVYDDLTDGRFRKTA
jgi:hypothetical protein